VYFHLIFHPHLTGAISLPAERVRYANADSRPFLPINRRVLSLVLFFYSSSSITYHSFQLQYQHLALKNRNRRAKPHSRRVSTPPSLISFTNSRSPANLHPRGPYRSYVGGIYISGRWELHKYLQPNSTSSTHSHCSFGVLAHFSQLRALAATSAIRISIGRISLYIPLCVFATTLVLTNSSQLTDPKQQAATIFVVRAARELTSVVVSHSISSLYLPRTDYSTHTDLSAISFLPIK